MIDFSQGGRPIGSMDLAPEVVADLGVEGPASLPGGALEALFLNLAAGPVPAAPDLVIKVFEHRLAGHPGRLQFVLSSTRRELSDLPVLDGDLGTLDLRSEVADWVGEQLRRWAPWRGRLMSLPRRPSGPWPTSAITYFVNSCPQRFKNSAGRFGSAG